MLLKYIWKEFLEILQEENETLPIRKGFQSVVYIEEEECFGIMSEEHLYYSVVSWYKDGLLFEKRIYHAD